MKDESLLMHTQTAGCLGHLGAPEQHSWDDLRGLWRVLGGTRVTTQTH